MKKNITYKPVVHNGEKRILVLFDYDNDLVQKLKIKTNAKWSKTMRGWHIADTAAYRAKCKLPLENDPVIKDKIDKPEKKSTIVKKGLAASSINIPANITLPLVTVRPIQTKKNEVRIGIFFNNNSVPENIIKQIKHIKWSEINVCWHLPCTEKSYDELCNAVKDIATIQNKALALYLKK